MIAKPSASKDLKKNPKVDPKVDPKVLVIDVGGTHVKLLMTGQKEPTKFVSGPSMTAARAVRDIKLAVKGWKFDCISIGHPGPRQLQRGQNALPRPRHRPRLRHDFRRLSRTHGTRPSRIQKRKNLRG